MSQLTPQGFNRREITLSGRLRKLGVGVKQWRSRYFVLVGSQLHYYCTETTKESQGVVQIQNAHIRECEEERFQGIPILEIVVNGRVYQCAASSRGEMTMWIEALSAVSDVVAENRKFDQLEERIREAEWRRCVDAPAAASPDSIDGAADDDTEM
eukprot:TRINITY_DN44637_c0_g1_i1.p1 TRINITY_DN44637_c0_g1~~TRINITY_DN44637_c0_g1_i1.p1  ORF type:complete len:155 (+),score=39.49 TRINITY_DN44637_c0_g1_i1:58-522(+)